ncbi:hypothetical protein Tco_1352270 [Tanacetum coccineum]
MVGRGRQGRNTTETPVRERELRDIEVDDLRRQMQQLQKELQRLKIVDEERSQRSSQPTVGGSEYENHIFEYSRRLKPDEFLNWLHTLERVFDFKEFLMKENCAIEKQQKEAHDACKDAYFNRRSFPTSKPPVESSSFLRFQRRNCLLPQSNQVHPMQAIESSLSAKATITLHRMSKSKNYLLVEEECEEDYKPEFENEEVVYADQGEFLVCRNLCVQGKGEDDWLRHNIFHTRCASHEKVCDIIIDGESFKDVISLNMVEKLQLKREDYPHPYHLTVNPC